jgi:rhamnogalacturonan endolyase
MAKSGDNIIYMATYAGHDTEWRFIPRLNNSLFKTIPQCSDYTPGGTVIEAADCILITNKSSSYYGNTVSKYFGNRQMMTDTSHSVSGSGGTATMWMGNRETSSGGPFFRDIQVSAGSTGSNPYNYMKSAHAQTESWRQGLNGVYALSFGGTPDLGTIWDPMGMNGYVKNSGRGQVNATISGGNYVGYKNATAQYWSGAGLSPLMKAGTYTMTLFSGELEVATSTVTVSAGTTVNKSISSTFSFPSYIWRLGTWDGKPSEFMNAANCLVMHPSDHRQSSWGPKTVSSSSPGSWPCYMWRDENTGCNITFNLSSSQVAAHTVRIGITAANSGGRPQIAVNSWTSPAPSSSTQPDSRIVTIGTYRGNNVMYTYDVPASAFVSGANTLTVWCISGDSVSGWTGPAVSFDCIELLN